MKVASMMLGCHTWPGLWDFSRTVFHCFHGLTGDHAAASDVANCSSEEGHDYPGEERVLCSAGRERGKRRTLSGLMKMSTLLSSHLSLVSERFKLSWFFF